ncbi:MAG: rhomboid family protein [Desulfobacteraceae bacterium]|nr:MAG: rhomboid family protein [Desulfobacteraceae bacterium]
MKPILRQRCFNHQDREAVALCLECSRYFCRECITEHQDRVVCAVCLSALSQKERRSSSGWSKLIHACLFAAGMLVIWLSFYTFGRFLLRIPAEFHEGTIWKNLWSG